jgi:hypothetical protein
MTAPNAKEIARQHGGSKSGDGFLCRCPVASHGKGNGDRTPSLLISDGEKALLVKCFAGCEPRDILAALGIPAASRPGLRTIKASRAADNADEIISSTERAQWLWNKRKPVSGTIAEIYLRKARAYNGQFPATLGFLPAERNFPPALIAAYGFAAEPESGLLALAANDVRAVQLTRLLLDGSDRERGNKAKITIGRAASGLPIIVAPVNDGLGLAISEGTEDALSVYQATGLGAWAAGGASRMAALAESVPQYVEAATILVDDDDAGRRAATMLAAKLRGRGIEVRMTALSAAVAA